MVRAAPEALFEIDLLTTTTRLRPCPLAICQQTGKPRAHPAGPCLAASPVRHQHLIAGPRRHGRGRGPSDATRQGILPRRVVGERPSVVLGYNIRRLQLRCTGSPREVKDSGPPAKKVGIGWAFVTGERASAGSIGAAVAMTATPQMMLPLLQQREGG